MITIPDLVSKDTNSIQHSKKIKIITASGLNNTIVFKFNKHLQKLFIRALGLYDNLWPSDKIWNILTDFADM